METFGEKLKTLRMMHNLSQRELGQRMGGIKQQTIAQYEKKEKAPKLETVLKIADALGINPNVFYTDKQLWEIFKKHFGLLMNQLLSK